MRQALRINSDLEIYFNDDGRAWFGSKSGMQLAAVQLELSRWQDFVERWLETVEEPIAPKRIELSPEERRFKASVEASVKSMQKLGMSGNNIGEFNRSCVPTMIENNKSLDAKQIERIVDAVVSAL